MAANETEIKIVGARNMAEAVAEFHKQGVKMVVESTTANTWKITLQGN